MIEKKVEESVSRLNFEVLLLKILYKSLKKSFLSA
jgi:hypothetical protein